MATYVIDWFMLFYVWFINNINGECGYYIIHTNRAYIMNKCHSNIINAINPLISTSSKYACSAIDDIYYLTYQHWHNSSLCEGEPHLEGTIDCDDSDCKCQQTENCQIWSKQTTNCSIDEILQYQSLMVNQCFKRRYKNKCDKSGKIWLLTYEENSDCIGDVINEEIIDNGHEIEDNGDNDGYCIDYYCDIEEEEEMEDSEDTENDEENEYEDPSITGPEIPSTNNASLGWLLPVIALIFIITIGFYCWYLKAPNAEKYGEITHV